MKRKSLIKVSLFTAFQQDEQARSGNGFIRRHTIIAAIEGVPIFVTNNEIQLVIKANEENWHIENRDVLSKDAQDALKS